MIYATVWGATTGTSPSSTSARPRHLAPVRRTARPSSSASGSRKLGRPGGFGSSSIIPARRTYLWVNKELHFFARFGAQPFGSSDIADYHRQFPRRIGALTGEWTPDYLYYPWVPPLLAKAAPDTKLLLILRDPIERFRSGLASEIRNGAAHVGATIAEVVGYTMYAENLRRWMDHFPAEQLLILQYERCVAAPVEQLVATYRFLGLDPEYRPAILNRPVNKTMEEKIALDADVKSRLRDIFAPDVAELVKLVPTLDLTPVEGNERDVVRVAGVHLELPVRQWSDPHSPRPWSFTRVPLIGRREHLRVAARVRPSIWSRLTVESMISTVPRLLGRQALERSGEGAALGQHRHDRSRTPKEPLVRAL